MQPAITKADMALVAGTDGIVVRDELWSACWAARQQVQGRILEEDLELAYAGLYGYDPRIRDLYSASVAQLRLQWDEAFEEAVSSLQHVVLEFGELMLSAHSKPRSAELGNQLRMVLGAVELDFGQSTRRIVEGLREQLIVVISASDRDIVERRIQISPAVPGSKVNRPFMGYSKKGQAGHSTAIDQITYESLQTPKHHRQECVFVQSRLQALSCAAATSVPDVSRSELSDESAVDPEENGRAPD